MYKSDIDTIDRKLLDHLQQHGRASNLELAAITRLSPAQCHRRHRRLESAGFIVRYETRLNPETLGLSVIAFVNVSMEKTHAHDLEKFRQAVADLPHVLECYSVTGDFDYVLKVAADDLKSLSHFLMEKLMRVAGVGSVRSSVCLDEIKATGVLPLP
ncbi:Lrp/AsnC family transcriptional regulator [Oxalobacteraceae bacterium CAVE-383]|nr:Lrp/AsnC family transcriptional regulator [Oxalobacteraceae bacterium CAVE-383]